MPSPQSVFLVGAGYIGRNVLDQLLAAKHPVTTLVRRPEQASCLEGVGAKTVLGTLSDLQLLATQAAQHEVTINTASADDLPSVEAILSGVRQRVDAGQPSTYIHTSGTGALEDAALGMHKNEKIYRDDLPGDIDAIAPTSMHRHVDMPVIQAAREFGNRAKVVIILPPLVYGVNPAHRRHSFALTSLVRFSLKHGFAGYVGEGRNVWSVIHVRDLARAYMTILAYIQESAPTILQENPYFFVENGCEVSMLEAAESLGRILYDMGEIRIPEVQAFAESDYEDVVGPMTPRGFGCNSRSRSIRLQKLGWEPREKDIWTSWREPEVPSIVAALYSSSGQ